MNPAAPLPRLRQVPGGWLLARDLTEAPRLPALRLAPHHIAAHRTWGVSAGLVVMAADGDLSVTSGCAVDRCGRVAILSATDTHPLPAQGPFAVVLRVRGDGPQARVLLREPGRVADLDVPLGTLDAQGAVMDGDGHRQWLRLPGPVRRLGGVVPRGAPVTGDASVWTAHVDLSHHRLPRTPAVMASPSGPPPEGASGTTVEVTNQHPDGFDVVVRHTVMDRDPPAGAVLTAPVPLAWLAVLPAARPEFPSEEWS